MGWFKNDQKKTNEGPYRTAAESIKDQYQDLLTELERKIAQRKIDKETSQSLTAQVDGAMALWAELTESDSFKFYIARLDKSLDLFIVYFNFDNRTSSLKKYKQECKYETCLWTQDIFDAFVVAMNKKLQEV